MAVANSKHRFTTSFLQGRCRKAMLGVCGCGQLQALVYDILPSRKVPESDARSVWLWPTPSTGLRHPSFKEGAGKRCSECVAVVVYPEHHASCCRGRSHFTKKKTLQNGQRQTPKFQLYQLEHQRPGGVGVAIEEGLAGCNLPFHLHPPPPPRP